MDLLSLASSYGEIRVQQPRPMTREMFRQPIGPPSIPPVAVGIEQALGGAIAYGYVQLERMQPVAPIAGVSR